MSHSGGHLAIVGIHGHGNLDLGSADHEHVHASLGQGLEELGCHARVGAHADADYGNLGDLRASTELATTTIGIYQFTCKLKN